MTLLVWKFIVGASFSFALERMVTVMDVSCPHALGLAVPLVVAISTSIAAKRGLLIRDGGAFESSRNIQAIVFDKTGTLTEGQFRILKVIRVSNDFTSDEELLDYVSALESQSEHPIARGIVSPKPSPRKVEAFRALPGVGAEATIDGLAMKIVGSGYLREQNLQYTNGDVTAQLDQGILSFTSS
ncbi:MAG: HAD family hydrolase [Bacteroidota bacterium]|nr:HAD family hydrolase [Bacteroidota bacterium]MDP4233239.1 HAD family hydrolase [Bacteroidota bacterium]MDP4242141.1 HAD family hydrolase [Bacteroidota bacterium]MDP4287790.1 HAD family hydrolase [Bacteroidota bacterium]